jgi:hypothetical protein
MLVGKRHSDTSFSVDLIPDKYSDFALKGGLRAGSKENLALLVCSSAQSEIALLIEKAWKCAPCRGWGAQNLSNQALRKPRGAHTRKFVKLNFAAKNRCFFCRND